MISHKYSRETPPQKNKQKKKNTTTTTTEFSRIPPDFLTEFRLIFAQILTSAIFFVLGGGGGTVPPCPVSYAYIYDTI